MNLTPRPGESLRWKPSHGKSTCILEWVMQTTWQHRVLVYIAVVVTLTLVVQLTGVGR